MTFPFIYFLFFCLILLGPISVRSKCFAIFLTLFFNFFLFFRLSKMMRNDIKPVLSYFYVLLHSFQSTCHAVWKRSEKRGNLGARDREDSAWKGKSRVLASPSRSSSSPPLPPPPSLWNVANQPIIFISPYDAYYHCTFLQCSLCNTCI